MIAQAVVPSLMIYKGIDSQQTNAKCDSAIVDYRAACATPPPDAPAQKSLWPFPASGENSPSTVMQTPGGRQSSTNKIHRDRSDFIRDPEHQEPELPCGRHKEWPRRVAIVPWGRFVSYDRPATLTDKLGNSITLASPGDLPNWANRQTPKARVST